MFPLAAAVLDATELAAIGREMAARRGVSLLKLGRSAKNSGPQARASAIGVAPLSFLSLLKTHEYLNELFIAHQEALLERELETARARLLAFERELRAHMQYEESVLLPVYKRAGQIPGGETRFYTGEHQRMLEFLPRIRERLQGLTPDRPDLNRQIVRLFDEEARFKGLVEHHDAREQNLLYPALDRVTTEGERKELLAQEHLRP